MQKWTLRFQDSGIALTPDQLEYLAESWLMAGDIQQHSATTLSNRRLILHNLVWFLREKEKETCDTDSLRAFLYYITHGHKEPGGRWGNPQQTRPVRPRTVQTYHGHLKTFFRWIVMEGALSVSPMDRIPTPVDRPDEVQPFTAEEVKRMLSSARKGSTPKRDEALLLLLLDTGLRASEAVSLRVSDVDIHERRITVLGKGNKKRMVSFQQSTLKALWSYIQDEEKDREPYQMLFKGQHGPLTRSGLLVLVRKLGERAKPPVPKAHPHRFRHTFSTEFLRAGGNQFTLMKILGHTNIKMTARYVRIAEADVANQHRQFSPVERMFRKGR